MSWQKTNDLILVIKCTKSEFAHKFVDLGQIKFSTPKSWEQYGKKGRGDIYEGTLAFTSKFFPEQYNQIAPKYSNTCTYELPNRILIKNRFDMKLPCVCFYGLKNGAFPEPSHEGKVRLSTSIGSKYFQDFADNATPEEISALPDKDKPAVVVIKDWQEFMNRLITKLISLGIPKDSIIISPINYYDFTPYDTDDSYLDFNTTPPYELFIKSKADFGYQNELRIVINSHNPDILRQFDSPIEIGNLSDIANVADHYLSDGIEITATFDTYITP